MILGTILGMAVGCALGVSQGKIGKFMCYGLVFGMILGVSTCDKGDFSGYFIAVATEKPVPDGMEEYIIPCLLYTSR